MHSDEMGRPRRLREMPPPWPRRNDENDEDEPERRQRWDREIEPFEEHGTAELYPGSLVIDDLSAAADNVTTLRILARYTVIRVLLLSAAGMLAGTKLRVERRIALEHLALLPPYDWERRALERLAVQCAESPAPPISGVIIVAAEAAAKRGHAMGAFALYRAAYEIARARHWWGGAAQAARGVANLARLEEAHRSVRLWERRAAVLERRAARTAGTAAPPHASG